MNIYFIPGVGADKRIFKNIQIPEGCRSFYLEWIRPMKNESLEKYSYRLAEKIDTSKPFIVVGLSFGGMLASEIIKKFPSGKMIIISGIPSSEHLPGYYKVAGKLRLHKLLPVSLFKSASLLKRLFTVETAEQKAYLRKAIREIDTSFIRWALDAIINWKGKIENVRFVHIHGSRDMVLPVRYCKPTHVIRGGGHLMVLTRGDEISDIIRIYCSNSGF